MNTKDLEHIVKLKMLDVNVPEWAEWVCVDDDGLVFVFEKRPYLTFSKVPTFMDAFYWTIKDIKNENTVRLPFDVLEELRCCVDLDWENPRQGAPGLIYKL